MRNQIIQGSVLDAATWADIPDKHVQTCITSPPYWGLRDYGVEGQLGLESTPEEYVERMVQVFRHVRRILRDDGTLWLNLGESYNGAAANRSGNNGYDDGRANRSSRFTAGGAPGLKPKDLCGIPWRVALALQADGWYLRQDIIWHKPNPMPESVRDRCTKAHEYLFLLTKKPRYFCDMEAVKEPAAKPEDKRRPVGSKGAWQMDGREQGANGGGKPYDHDTSKRNKRSVWTIPPAPYKEAHFATFPPKLIEPCVLAGTSAKGCCADCGAPWTRMVEKSKTFQSGSGKSGNPINGKNGPECQGGGDTGDIRKGPCVSSTTTGWEAGCQNCNEIAPCIVFDPFMGSGTTGMVAKQNGRDYLGLELNAEYLEMAKKRIRGVQEPLFT